MRRPRRHRPVGDPAVRVVVQRVSRASVTVAGRPVGEIGRGLLVLAGFTGGDGDEAIDWMADKLANLRVFPDDDGKMNRSLLESGGEVLVVSQFTLYGDAQRGRRPSFVDAAAPAVAEPLYQRLVAALREQGLRVATGEFGAMMAVELVNDGPVTLVLEK
jgi:D-tyrosyl-tRNA(Tyr) deacylase